MYTFSTARTTGAAQLKAGEDVGQLEVEGEAAVLDGQWTVRATETWGDKFIPGHHSSLSLP
jgi:hypothetical protein